MSLNEDCLERIFKYFTPKEWIVFSEVCSTWNNVVARIFHSIKKIKIYPANYGHVPVFIDDLSAKEVYRIMRFLTKVNSVTLINFDHWGSLTDRHCTININSNFMYELLDRDYLGDIINECLCILQSQNCIKTLKLSHVDVRKIDLCIVSPNLEHLSMTDVVTGIEDEFRPLIHQLPNLQSFQLQRESACAIIEEDLETVVIPIEFLDFKDPPSNIETDSPRSFHCFQNLRTLIITDKNLSLSDDTANLLLSTCSQLETVHLGSLQHFSTKSWRQLMSFPNLKSVGLSAGRGITSLEFTNLASKLTSLSLYDLKPEVLKSILNSFHLMPLLSDLTISFPSDEPTFIFVLSQILHFVTSQGRRVILEYGSRLKRLIIMSKKQKPATEILEKCDSDFKFQFYIFIDVDAESIIKRSTNLILIQ